MKGTYNNGFRGSNHSNDANALFFFENKQGKGQSLSLIHISYNNNVRLAKGRTQSLKD